MTTRTSYWIALLVGMVGFSALVQHFSFTCDDAYITFRYSRNLAEGRGLVFNYAEDPAVEGYSNFLWTVWLALFYAMGAKGEFLGTVANTFSIASAVALLAMVTRLAQRRLELRPHETIATAVFLGTMGPFALWATGGLETMPFALALFAVYERLLGDPERPRGVQAGLCAIAAGLLRADGFLWVGVVLDLALLTWIFDRKRRDLLRAFCVTLALLAVGVGAHFLWRHSYYGEWMPNTARVKAGFSDLRFERGLNYVATFLLTVPSFALLPLAALGLRGKPSPALAFQSLGVVLFAVVYALYVGGDFMPLGRFLVPAVPFVALLFAVAVGARPSPLSLGLGAALIAVGLLLTTNVVRLPQDVLQRFHFRWNSPSARSEYEQWFFQRYQADRWAEMARGLALYAEPGESIVRGPVGAVGYFTDLHVYDLNGLVTLEVSQREAPLVRASPGHDKHVDPDFFFPLQPTYLGAVTASSQEELMSYMTPLTVQMIREGKLRMERRPLPPDQGFTEGAELFALRLVWN